MKIHVVKSERHQRRKRVAAYCRVSTLDSSQEESYETQKEYYEDFIRCHDEWDFAGIYADQGISGTSAEKRPQFMACIEDSIGGKIDLILVKSISRFSRNIVDCQSYVAKLKSYGVEVYFEKESLSTMDPSSGMIFSLMGLIAQSESESISQNVKWAIRKRQEEGTYVYGNNRIFGYDTIDGQLVPNKDAWVVRFIFQKYLEGWLLTKISDELADMGAHQVRSDKPIAPTEILQILQNEVYVGDRRMQKQPPINLMTKKPDPNAEYQTYYFKDHHQPIIDRNTWDKTQAEIHRRREMMKQGVQSGGNHHFLYGKIFCGLCGAPMVRRTNYRKDGSYKLWSCSERRRGSKGNGCALRRVKEDELLKEIQTHMGFPAEDPFPQEAFLERVNKVLIFQYHIELEYK